MRVQQSSSTSHISNAHFSYFLFTFISSAADQSCLANGDTDFIPSVLVPFYPYLYTLPILPLVNELTGDMQWAMLLLPITTLYSSPFLKCGHFCFPCEERGSRHPSVVQRGIIAVSRRICWRVGEERLKEVRIKPKEEHLLNLSCHFDQKKKAAVVVCMGKKK